MSITHPSFGTLDDNRIIIFDTTLRDGEQSPGFSMNHRSARRPMQIGAGQKLVPIRQFDQVKLSILLNKCSA